MNENRYLSPNATKLVVSENSWHYRFLKFAHDTPWPLSDNPNSCEYVRRLISGALKLITQFLAICAVFGCIVFAGIYLPLCTLVVNAGFGGRWVPQAAADIGVFIWAIYLAIAVYFLYYKHAQRQKFKPTVPDSALVQIIKAKHDKICLPIEIKGN